MQLAHLFGKTEKAMALTAPQSHTEERVADPVVLQAVDSDIVTMLRFSTCYPNFFIDQSLFR